MFLYKIIRNNQDILFYLALQKSLSHCKSVLDVGCGKNSPISRIKKTFFTEGIDIFKASIAESKKRGIHDKYVVGDLQNLDKIYKPKSFDGVIALDVIEHFEKKQAIALIKKMEKIARKKVILLTPNGFYHQEHLEGNPYQEHKSGWSLNDLKSLDYKIYGLRGLKFIRGETATIKYKPWIIWGLLAFITEPLLFLFPALSYHFFAVKSKEK